MYLCACACEQTCVSRFAHTLVLVNFVFTDPVLAWIAGAVIMVDLTVHTYIETKIKSYSLGNVTKHSKVEKPASVSISIHCDLEWVCSKVGGPAGGVVNF